MQTPNKQPLDKRSWIVRIAYAIRTSEIPAQVDLCTLWQRFALMLLPWLVGNFITWFLGGLVLGVIGQPIWRAVLFIGTGRKLVYDGLEVRSDSPVLYANTLVHLCVLSYEAVDIDWLDWSDMGGTRSPILKVMAVALCLALLYGVGWYVVPYVFWSGVDTASEMVGYAYSTLNTWGLVVAGVVLLALLIYFGKKGYNAFASTPSGEVIVAQIKGWREKHCTIYELVEN